MARWWWALALVVVMGCAPADGSHDGDGSHAGGHRHDGVTEFALLDAAAVAARLPGGVGEFAPVAGGTFRQVGLRFRGPADGMLTAQVQETSGRWGDWRPVEVTWREGAL
ncbi:MAG: hypothetical protein H6703_17045, partial [Myxococcales bacterium]|nr:hypothetical protein [Myxococcales bacterium]